MNEDERCDSAERLCGHRFRDPALVRAALTHKSWLHENPGDGPHNERLEFLGDAVLDLVAAELLFEGSPRADEGELTRRRAAWVSEPPLAAAARRHALGELLRLGRGERRNGGSDRESLLADAMEALIGAVFVDAGFDAARDAVLQLLAPAPGADPRAPTDVKNTLQERLQAEHGAVPEYVVDRVGGREHAPRFRARVLFRGETLGEGEAGNTKTATKAAAAAALAALEGLEDAG